MKRSLLVFLAAPGWLIAEPRPAPAAFERGVEPSPDAVPTTPATEPTVEMVGHPDVPCQGGKTVIWTAAIQVAFDRVLGPKAPRKLDHVEPDNVLIDRMGTFSWSEEAVLPKDGWFAVAGQATKELADEATMKWRTLAGPAEKPFEVKTPPGMPGLAAFAGIKRDFLFKEAFYPAKTGLMEWGSEKLPVKFFGVAGSYADHFTGTVRVLASRPDENVQALQFLAKEGDDTMILYQPHEGQSMGEAIAWVKSWQAAWAARADESLAWDDKRLHEMDDLRVPVMSLVREEEMREAFKGDLHFKDDPETWKIIQAETSMRLEVNARGVMFKAEAASGAQAAGVPSHPSPRHFWFDRPFFLFLWRDGAEFPYAAVWIGNAEGLVKK